MKDFKVCIPQSAHAIERLFLKNKKMTARHDLVGVML